MKRRDFLKTSAAGTVLASSARMRSSLAESNKPIRCGILGLGHAHGMDALGVLRNLDEFEVVGYCEPESGIADRYRSAEPMKGLPSLTEEELLGDPTVQMVAVESDVPRLLDFAEKAVAARKHIHLDKPAGTSLPRFKKILDEAKEKNLLVQMGYMYRYNPGFDLIRRAVNEGWLGQVFSINASMCTDLSKDKRTSIAFHPGGVMLELGCHLIDMIVLLLGRPNKVTSFIRHDSPIEDNLADNTLAVFEYDRAMVKVESNAQETAAFRDRRFKVVGTEGSIILSPLEPPVATLAFRDPHGEFPKGVSEKKLPDLDRHILDFQDLAACIRGEKEFAYSKEHDYIVQETILRACGVEV